MKIHTLRPLRRLIPIAALLSLWIIPAAAGSLGKFVVVGDSLSAGFQNFSLFDSDSVPNTPPGGQKHGFAALVAQQAGVNLNLPLIFLPGFPTVLTIDSFGHISRLPPTLSGFRENPLLQTLDLSVPGFTVADALAHQVNVVSPASGIDVMALYVLGFPGLATNTTPCGALAFINNVLTLSEVACAVEQHPNTVLVSIGSNDALQALTLGITPTDTAHFTVSYTALLAALASTGAKIVVTNIPDVSHLPLLVSAAAFQAKCGFAAAGAGPGDFVVANLSSPTALSGDICSNYVVRSGALVASASQAVTAYNRQIAILAAAFGATVVDFNGLFANISAHGVQVGDQHLTTAFLGGLFSLDGMHPTNTGHAILANAIINAMNRALDTDIPPVSVVQVAKTDPLLPPN